jgi:hypothetical protein
MLQAAEKEVREIRQLALTPTPANFQAIQSKLEGLAALLSQAIANRAVLPSDTAQLRKFLTQLPVEMGRLRVLMHAPAYFYQQLETIRAGHFGSYERSGALRTLDSKPLARTVMHL